MILATSEYGISVHLLFCTGDERGVEFTQSELIAQVTVDESSRNVVTTVFEFADGENETTIFNGNTIECTAINSVMSKHIVRTLRN